MIYLYLFNPKPDEEVLPMLGRWNDLMDRMREIAKQQAEGK